MKFSSREPIRFLLAGGFNTAATYLVYLGMLQVAPYRVAYTTSFAVGIMLGYAINTWFVFRVPWNWKKMVAYPLVYLIQYVVGLLLLSLVVERGWIPQSELVHYKLHAEIDKRHAAEFFAAIETADEQMMTAGLALGLHLFDQLYAAFLR